MAQKWNLQDIRPVDQRERNRPRPPEVVVERTQPARTVPRSEETTIDTIVIENGNRSRSKRYVLVGVLAALVIGGSLALSVLFAETTITIRPITVHPNVNAEFEAFQTPQPGALSYTVLTLEATSEKQVNATGEKMVSEQAKGTIEIFKTTPGAERLKKSTRFESPDGLIFRIQESVVVPGAVMKDGVLSPGSIRAEVFAETAGEQYNLSAGTRFTIPGFKESNLTDLFTAMYATNPEPFAGGFDGPQFIIDESELGTARQELQIKLRDQLLADIKTKQPAGFVTFEGAYAFTYNELPPVRFGDDLVTIREQAVLQVPLFKSDEFAAFIAEQTVPTYNDNPVRIESYDGMLFSYSNPDLRSSVIANEASLRFTIVGKPRIIWEYDEEQLRADLAGKTKTVIPTIQKAYAPAIESFTVSMKPFYRRAFPTDGADIRIIEELPSEPE
jgi:hypothetical protein